MFGIGPSELIVVGFIALLLFGSRLPETMRNLGRGLNEFKKGMSALDDQSPHEPREVSSSRQ